MARERTTRYAILGMLTLGPRTGYDIRQEIGTSVRHFWSESYGQVYPTLHELEREGLVTVAAESSDGGRERKVYSLTDAGWDALRAWLVRPVAPQPSRNELLLKLYFGHLVPDSEMAGVVREVRDRWAREMTEWAAIEERLRAADRSATSAGKARRDSLFTLRYGRLVGEATVRWADEVLAELES